MTRFVCPQTEVYLNKPNSEQFREAASSINSHRLAEPALQRLYTSFQPKFDTCLVQRWQNL